MCETQMIWKSNLAAPINPELETENLTEPFKLALTITSINERIDLVTDFYSVNI